MKRRDFLKIGAGALILCRLDRLSAFQATGPLPQLNYPSDVNAYLHVGDGGHITCYVGKIEMGQGNMTALAQLVAQEIGVAVGDITMVMGDTGQCPWDLGTFGSMSVPVFGATLRKVVAEARETVRRSIPAAVLDKAPKTVVGASVPRIDGLEKVTGVAKYAGDIRLPNMLYAKVLRPPAHAAVPGNIDTSGARAIPGASVIKDGDLIAVLHEQPDLAALACARIAATFSRTAPPIDDRSIFDHLVAAAPPGHVVANLGSISEGGTRSTSQFEQVYFNAYVAHAPIETHTALASFDGDTLTVWASAQAPFMVKTQVAQALGLAADHVRIIVPFVGGGFGGKTMAPQAVEAARLARATGRPVQVAWDRSEEFFFDTFRPAAVLKIKSGMDADGRIVMWSGDIYGAGEGGAAPFYDIPHQRVVTYGGWQIATPGLHPFGVGAWRAPAFNSNAFAREQQMDVMAVSAGIDPVAFRLKNLKDARMVKVLQAAVDRFGWTPAAAPSRRGYGVACGSYANTYVAMCAEVAVDASTGDVQVQRVVCAQDMGLVVNPDGARMQIEGCITMGLGYALTEEIHFDSGVIAEKNFDTYRIPKFSNVPAITTVLIDASDRPPTAGGEPAIQCVGAALANAIADRIGARVWHLPMTGARVKTALAAAISH